MHHTHMTFAISLLLLAPSCVPPGDSDELGSVEQASTLSQGTLSQGTLSQGTTGAVWGFKYTNWYNSGVKLKITSVSQGRLIAAWDKTDACATSDTSITRACDWYAAGWAACTPGAAVSVGAGGCNLGSSSRDSMIRICAGNKPCSAASALASNDDTKLSKGCTASVYPKGSFICPSDLRTGGKYFVMVAPKTPSGTFSYGIGTSPSATINAWLAGGDFAGTTLDGVKGTSTVVRYRITATAAAPAADDPKGKTDFYTLVEDADGTTPLCYGADNRAIPLYGEWTSAGYYKSTVNNFTFGCTAGVIAKCYRFGYRPWDTSVGGVPLRDYHQTCTRTALADYCNNGGSHTVNGTKIDLFDRIPHVARVAGDGPNGTNLPLEAIWPREGTLTDQGDIVATRFPVCLAKKRWDTLPLTGYCASVITLDPRTYTGDDASLDKPVYCDDAPLDGSSGWLGSTRPDDLIANESAYIDAGLWRWKKKVGTDYRSTTTLTTTQSTDPNYTYAPTASPREPVFIGAVYAMGSSDSVRPANTIQLYSYFKASTGDYLTTTDVVPPSGYASQTQEGWILAPSCATDVPATCGSGAKALQLYLSGTDYYTGLTLKKGTTYTFVKTLGYLPR